MILTSKEKKEIRRVAKKLIRIISPQETTITYSSTGLLSGLGKYSDLLQEGDNWELVEKTYIPTPKERTQLQANPKAYFKIKTYTIVDVNHQKNLTEIITKEGWEAGQKYIDAIQKEYPQS